MPVGKKGLLCQFANKWLVHVGKVMQAKNLAVSTQQHTHTQNMR